MPDISVVQSPQLVNAIEDLTAAINNLTLVHQQVLSATESIAPAMTEAMTPVASAIPSLADVVTQLANASIASTPKVS
jgi:hypothetical protein